jgi:hypothetical protein
MKTEYNSIKGVQERSYIPFSKDERKISGLEGRQNNAMALSSYR